MIGKLIGALFQFIINLIQIVLLPLDMLIMAILPGNVTIVFGYMGAFFTMLGTHIGWVMSAFGIHFNIVEMLVLYYTVKLTLPVGVYVIKELLNWYNAIKP